MHKRTRFAAVILMVVALMCVFAVPTFASVHVTDWTVSSASMTSLSLESTGDAGQSHGNRNDSTSPIAPAVDPNSFFWFNQDVRVFDPAIADPDADADVVVTGGFWQFSADNVTWGPNQNTSFTPTDTPMVSAEGLYSVTATGFDGDDPTALATGTVTPAFGIDKTPPVTSSDARQSHPCRAS